MNAAAVPPVTLRTWLALAGFILACLAVGWLGSIPTTAAIPTWYAGLEKPPFNPPNAVFGPVWTILYVLMAFAGWRIWRASGEAAGPALVPFAVQLGLNLLWSFAFFGARSPLFGLVVIAALWLAILWTILVFRRIDRWAALLLLPYLAWVSFAALLNASIWWLN